MRIVFMGTSGFAVPALSVLASGGHKIEYVITKADMASSKRNKTIFSPVKERAAELGIEVAQPEKLRGNAAVTGKIASIAPELIVTAAYGLIIPREILGIPKYGCVNIHASLLPRWRGAAPVQRAILEGDIETGVTIMFMDEGLDTGDIILSRRTDIGRKTSSELLMELSVIGAELITETINMIQGGTAESVSQDEGIATYAPMIKKEDGKLDFRKTPEELDRVIRGMDPWPGAYAYYNEEMMKIWEATPLDKVNMYPPGAVTDVSGRGLEISSGGGTLLITGIQMPGRRKVKIIDYLKGNEIEKFSILS